MIRPVAACFLLAAAAHAQLPPTSETINVDIIEIDAVVLDANGKPVTGLRPSDFELRIGGRKRTITNFYEVDRREEQNGVATPGGAPARRDYIVLFIDDLHLNQHEKKRALDGLRTFVNAHVRSGTAAMLVALSGNMRILEKFTEDPQPIVKAIDDFERHPGRANELDRERRELLNYIDEVRVECTDPKSKICRAETIPQRIEVLADLQEHMAEQTVSALDSMAGVVAGLDGRRVLVYVSDGLPMQPAAEVYQYFKPEEFFQPRGENVEILRTIQQSLPLDAMKTSLPARFRALARRAGGNGVQFFTIDARGVQGFDEGIENSAARSRLDSSFIRANLHGPIQFLADETGGRAIIDENDMNLAFDKLNDHLASYYSIGFQSDASGREDDVSVSVKRRGLTVRATRHVRQRTAREEIADRVRAALYARVQSNLLDAAVTMTPGDSGVKVTIRVPTAKLSILPGQQTSFAVFVAMLDDKMQETPVRGFVHRIGSLETAESMQVLTLNAPPGTYTVSLAISDSYSLQVSYVQQDVTVRRN